MASMGGEVAVHQRTVLLSKHGSNTNSDDVAGCAAEGPAPDYSLQAERPAPAPERPAPAPESPAPAPESTAVGEENPHHTFPEGERCAAERLAQEEGRATEGLAQAEGLVQGEGAAPATDGLAQGGQPAPQDSTQGQSMEARDLSSFPETSSCIPAAPPFNHAAPNQQMAAAHADIAPASRIPPPAPRGAVSWGPGEAPAFSTGPESEHNLDSSSVVGKVRGVLQQSAQRPSGPASRGDPEPDPASQEGKVGSGSGRYDQENRSVLANRADEGPHNSRSQGDAQRKPRSLSSSDAVTEQDSKVLEQQAGALAEGGEGGKPAHVGPSVRELVRRFRDAPPLPREVRVAVPELVGPKAPRPFPETTSSDHTVRHLSSPSPPLAFSLLSPCVSPPCFSVLFFHAIQGPLFPSLLALSISYLSWTSALQ